MTGVTGHKEETKEKEEKDGGEGKLLRDGTDIEGSTRGPRGPKKIKISKSKKKSPGPRF